MENNNVNINEKASKVIDEKKEVNYGKNRLILFLSVITAFAATICFKGKYIVSSLSSVVFYNMTALLLCCILHRLKLVTNKRAYIYILPVFVLSLFNAYFYYNEYNTYNFLAFLIILAIMSVRLCNGHITLFSLLRILLNNVMESFFESIKINVKGNKNGIKNIILGLAISFPVLFVILCILSVSDEMFSNTVNDIFNNILFDEIVWTIVFFCITLLYFCGVYYYSTFVNKRNSDFEEKTVNKTVALAFLTPVNLLFCGYFLSQLGYAEPGVVLSQYVREGFFGLLFVTFINFSIVLTFTEIFRNVTIKSVAMSLVMLTVFTLMLIVLTMYKLYVYISSYGFTQLRIEVLVFLVLELILVAITIYSLLKGRINIFKHFVVVVLSALFILNITARPEFAHRLNYELLDMIPGEVSKGDVPLIAELYKEGKLTRSETMTKLYNSGIIRKDTYEGWQSFTLQGMLCDKKAEELMTEG